MSSENGTNERVTMRTLRDGLDLVRQEQKTEHTKTRAMIAVLALPSIGKAVSIVGAVFFGWRVGWFF